jgi:hypothetical protein
MSYPQLDFSRSGITAARMPPDHCRLKKASRTINQILDALLPRPPAGQKPTAKGSHL